MRKLRKCDSKRLTRVAYVARESQARNKRGTKLRKDLASLAAGQLILLPSVPRSQNDKVQSETHPLTKLGIVLREKERKHNFVRNMNTSTHTKGCRGSQP